MLKHVLILSAGILSVSGSSAAESYSCWDGSTVADAAYCPPQQSVTQCYFGPPERYISVTGLEDEAVMVYYGADEMLTSIRYSIADADGPKKHMYFTQYTGQTEASLEIKSESSEEYPALMNADGDYEIRNSGGARMTRFECLFNSVKAAVESNDEPYQEIILNCG